MADQPTFDEQTDLLQRKDDQLRELEARLADRDRLAALLTEAEQRLAEIPILELQIADLRVELNGARVAEQSARDEIRELDGRLMAAQRNMVSILTSPSWKLTRPLREGKRAAQVAKRLLRS